VEVFCPGSGGDPVTGGGSVIISAPTSSTQPTVGNMFNVTTNINGASTVYTLSSKSFGKSIFWTSFLVDSPSKGTQTDTGEGGVVSGNYCVLNELTAATATISNGGLSYSATSSSSYVGGTVPMSSGKWYWEVQGNYEETVNGYFGIAKTATVGQPGVSATSYAYISYTGEAFTNNISSSYGSAFTASGDVLGVAFDADAGKLYFAKNNVWQNLGNPVTSVNPAFSNLLSGPYLPVFGNGGTTSVLVATTLTVNFGQLPYTYTAPTGYRSLIADPVATTLTFTDATNLTNFSAGNAVSEVGGDASGTVVSVNLSFRQMTVGLSSGTWTVGETVQNNTTLVAAPAPTTEPPNPLLYTLIASSTNSPTDLTSFSVAKPPLDPLVTYYARVSYKSNATVVTSSLSPWSGFTTGAL
jgi:hypothetical protein